MSTTEKLLIIGSVERIIAANGTLLAQLKTLPQTKQTEMLPTILQSMDETNRILKTLNN